VRLAHAGIHDVPDSEGEMEIFETKLEIARREQRATRLAHASIYGVPDTESEADMDNEFEAAAAIIRTFSGTMLRNLPRTRIGAA
jgi:hypothetical protein